MLSPTLLQSLALLAGANLTLANPVWPRYTVAQEHFEVIQMRASSSVNPDAVTNMNCIDSSVNIASHDQNVAELDICGGIAGAITKCGGASTSTTGESGTAKFSLTAAMDGAKIDISKERWEQCIRAARAVCPTGSMSGTCVEGASTGDVDFTLDRL